MRKFVLAALLLAFLAVSKADAQNTSAGLTPCSTGSSLSVSNSSGNVQMKACGGSAIVINIGSVEAFLNLGVASTTAATTSGWSIPPGFAYTINVGTGQPYLAAITASGNTTLRIIQGVGAAAVGGGAPSTGGGAANAGYPAGASPITGNATGSTGAVVGTLAGVSAKTTYICGFNVSAIGGTAAVGPITIAGLITSSMVYHLASAAAGVQLSQTFTPCIPASAVATAITITTTADGTATAVDVNSWGFQL